MCEEASRWNATEEARQLEHSQRDHDQGVRAYGLGEVDILKCHVANLAPQVGGDKGQGLMLRYVATYGVKPSSEFHNELLADTNISGYGLAFFFYCIAELAVKPCRSSRSKTRGGLRKSHDTSKRNNKNTNTKRPAASVRGW